MKRIFPLLVVGLAATLLASAGSILNKISLNVHPNSFVNGLAIYQLAALSVGLLVTFIILKLTPSSKHFLKVGNLSILPEKERWLGINGKSTWLTNGLQLAFFITMATSIFMVLAVYSTRSFENFQWGFLPLVILFSFTNSLAEELIFRFGVLGGLFEHYPKRIVLIISAILFGLPHYFGWPSGFIGVLLSGTLGYVLAKATLETKGLSVAWVIHFVQDVIIFTALFMMNGVGR